MESLKGFLVVLGWIFFPYIMIFFRWKLLGNIGKFFGLSWAIICILGGIANISSNSSGKAAAKNEEKAPKVISKNEEKIIVSKDFLKFDAGYSGKTEIQQDKIYENVKGKYVEWVGRVTEVSSTFGKILIHCKAKSTTFSADFVIDGSGIPEDLLMSLQVGDTISVRGKITGQGSALLPWTLSKAEIFQITK